MIMCVWYDAEGITNREHNSGGGVVVLAPSKEVAEDLIKYNWVHARHDPYVTLNSKARVSWPPDEILEEPQGIWAFPNTSC